MLKPSRLTIGSLVALAIVTSGCGSTETASTGKTAAANASTSAPNKEAVQTASQSTGTEARQTTKAPVQKAPEQKTAAGNPHRIKGSKRSVEAPPAIKVTAPQVPPVPLTKQYPEVTQRAFIGLCTAAKGSPSSCECLLAKFENRHVQKGESLAELLGLEVALKDRIELSPRAQQFAKACKTTI